MQISGSSKGNRNAGYRLAGAVSGTVKIDADWNPGACTGGSSYGELRFADSSNKVFLSFRKWKDSELQYSYGGGISNQGLETAPWNNVGLTSADNYHLTIIADFAAKTADFTVTHGSSKLTKSVTFTDAEDFGAIEALAVRQEKNFDWTMSIDNIKIAMK